MWFCHPQKSCVWKLTYVEQQRQQSLQVEGLGKQINPTIQKEPSVADPYKDAQVGRLKKEGRKGGRVEKIVKVNNILNRATKETGK